ncbi:MAG: hypothetical protein U0M96_03585 [Eggerthellaceae bacterium]
MKIETRRLLLVAGIVWAIAGVNITIIGVGAYAHDWGAPVIGLLLATLIIFTLFHLFIFNKMVRKHADRIGAYEEAREPIWFFFDTKGYVIMAIMMGGGIALRMSGALPDWFIAFFYTGLGLALLLAGISFVIRYFARKAAWCPVRISGKPSR